ncbi:hypothetical protein [Hymenobacter norwichensis]|uniref:hypothetical protein n=1 Tax=Hymenobacter norwichensis TaxID=223903 RepID=UPI0003B360D5|nr:hypothetical protein [Hymenobacter norwichensis]
MPFSISACEIEQAGFLPAVGLPSGTTYEQGQLYVCLTPQGTLRLHVTDGDDNLVELSSGNLYDPVVHYAGSITDSAELFRLMHYVRNTGLAA